MDDSLPTAGELSVFAKLFVYDIKSRQIVSNQFEGREQRWKKGVEGVVRFSPCEWVQNQGPTYPSDRCDYVTPVEGEWRLFASNTVHTPENGLRSRNGFHIGRGGRWVEDSRGRKLFWLPLDWMARYTASTIWEGNLLGFVDGRHEKPILIQF